MHLTGNAAGLLRNAMKDLSLKNHKTGVLECKYLTKFKWIYFCLIINDLVPHKHIDLHTEALFCVL